jgi:hypothetical protein
MTKAQAFAAHVRPEDADQAIAHAQSLLGDRPVVGGR